MLRLTSSLIAAGAASVLLAALGLVGVRGPLNEPDVVRALRPLGTVPLDRVRSPAGTKIDVTVPADSQWARIVGAWGNRGILVVAVSPDRPGRQTYNLAELGIILAIERNKKPIECDPEDQPPYPYSAASLQNGRHCDASPGDLVTVLARTNSVQTLTEGVLAVFAHWDKVRVINTNETLAIARDVRRIAGALAAFGCALITVGLWRRRSVRRQP